MKEKFKGIYNGNIWMSIYQYMYLTRKTLWVYDQNDVPRNMDIALLSYRSHTYFTVGGLLYFLTKVIIFFALASNFTFLIGFQAPVVYSAILNINYILISYILPKHGLNSLTLPIWSHIWTTLTPVHMEIDQYCNSVKPYFIIFPNNRINWHACAVFYPSEIFCWNMFHH